eukprot:gene7029-1256_t
MHLTRSVVRASLRQVRYASGRFDNVKMGPEDPILGLALAYNKDTHPQKVSLGAGAYRDDDGKPYVLPCVKKAQMMLHDADLDNEYAPIAGLSTLTAPQSFDPEPKLTIYLLSPSLPSACWKPIAASKPWCAMLRIASRTSGVPAFTKVAAQLLFGEDSPALKDGRVASVQSISGTGALRLGGEFLAKCSPSALHLPLIAMQASCSCTGPAATLPFRAVLCVVLSATLCESCEPSGHLAVGICPRSVRPRVPAFEVVPWARPAALPLTCCHVLTFHPGTVYLPKPTWGNHNPIFEDSHLELGTYRLNLCLCSAREHAVRDPHAWYYRPSDCGLDFDGMCEDITKAAPGTVVLHACAHNPTGVDPSPEQWQQLSSALKGTDHLVFLDAAYQGFASGDPVKDAYAVRHFVEQGHSLVITKSFAKNFGLYGHRIGCLHVVCGDKDEADRVMSQLKILARSMYSNPPIHGARIVERVLTDDKLKTEWARDVKVMADRIIDARAALVSALAAAGSTKDWNHITNQIGMFAFTGLTPEQVKRMIDEFHIYLTGNGRISMAGITSKNVQYVAEAMHK